MLVSNRAMQRAAYQSYAAYLQLNWHQSLASPDSCPATPSAGTTQANFRPLNRHACRNVTFTGLPGQQPLLDFDFNLSVLELCNICTFTIADMAIANERRGANAQLDFFLGRGGSVLNLTNVVRKRMSCTSIEPALRLVRNTQRSPRFPARDGSKDQVRVCGQQHLCLKQRELTQRILYFVQGQQARSKADHMPSSNSGHENS
jgi:hypothetical protein